MNTNEPSGPVERATLSIPRTFARTQMVEDLASAVRAGYEPCEQCPRHMASRIKEVGARVRALCDACFADVELDAEIKRQRQQRARMGSRR
jgi:hypothetical protein